MIKDINVGEEKVQLKVWSKFLTKPIQSHFHGDVRNSQNKTKYTNK